MALGGVTKIPQVLHDCFATGAAESSYREVVRISQFGRTTQIMGEYLVRSDPFWKISARERGMIPSRLGEHFADI